MKCRVCGAALESRVTDVPFKTGDSSIVILKDLPVLQFRQCGDIELENSVRPRLSRCSMLWTVPPNWRSSGTPRRFEALKAVSIARFLNASINALRFRSRSSCLQAGLPPGNCPHTSGP